MTRARELGVEDHVVFLDQFVDQATLLEFISMCDVYVTPYLNEAQMTSGTLAYSFGLGKAVVSTPYWHARELLADGRGVLVAVWRCCRDRRRDRALLTDEPRRQAMRERAYADSRSMTWERTAERYWRRSRMRGRVDRLKVVARDSDRPRSYRKFRRRRPCKRTISCRCATTPACFSTPFIRCRSVARLLRRRQCARAAAGLRAQRAG